MLFQYATGVADPRLVIQSSTILEAYWDHPVSPNGLVISYHLYQSAQRGTITLVYSGPRDVLNTKMAQLTPGMAYSYILEVVTGGGKTNSSMVTVTMPTVSPSGIKAPTNVTALGPHNIYVMWNMPILAGTIDQFRLVLNAGSSTEIERGAGIASNAVVGGLKPYTTYNVRIKACLQGIPNGCGIGPGRSVKTLEAPPQGQAPPTLIAKGSSVVEVSWEPPEDPNGVILRYRVHRRQKGISGPGLLINVLTGDDTSFTNAGPDLKPFTVYEYRITTVNSQGETVSDWEEVQTLEAIPEGLARPSIVAVDAYSLSVAWRPPTKPNGKILWYKVEFRQESNDPTYIYPVQTVTVNSDAREVSVSGLKPYTRHEVRVGAVNSAGMLATDWVETITGQAAPADIGPFSIETVSTGLSAILRWSIPGQPNGVITNYLIYEEGNINPIFQGLSREFEYRRLQPYSQYKVQLEACTFSGCGRSPLQTFNTAEIPPSDQPAPVIGDFNATHIRIEWNKPVNANGKILKYQVLRRTDVAITKRALTQPVIVYETEETGEDSYTYVDSGLLPFTGYEYLIKVINSKGSTDSFWQSIQTDQAPPEGLDRPVVLHFANEHDKLRITWTAPTRANGILQSYQLQRNQTVPWSFGPDDPTEYVDSGLTAYTLYSYRLTACTAGGCTTSDTSIIRTQETAPFYVAPPILTTVSDSAIKASWSEPQITNGRIREYRLRVNNETQYIGQDREFIVRGLTPYQAYDFVVVACTYGGCTDSSAVLARPQEAPPAGMQIPVVRVTSSSSIEITWQPPTFPNGIITSYEVRRDGTLIDTTTGLSYIDYEVAPGVEYSYRVTAFNSRGSTQSPPATATTYSTSPTGLTPPILTPLTSTSIRAEWLPPLHPNGQIYNYTLYKDNDIVYSETGLETVVTGLDFWTQYSFRIQACTRNGCATSDPQQVRTLEASPLGMARPKLTAIADVNGVHDGVLVEWAPPRRPNGIITKYEVYRRNSTGRPLGEFLNFE